MPRIHAVTGFLVAAALLAVACSERQPGAPSIASRASPCQELMQTALAGGPDLLQARVGSGLAPQRLFDDLDLAGFRCSAGSPQSEIRSVQLTFNDASEGSALTWVLIGPGGTAAGAVAQVRRDHGIEPHATFEFERAVAVLHRPSPEIEDFLSDGSLVEPDLIPVWPHLHRILRDQVD
jgi:hypothetical protein